MKLQRMLFAMALAYGAAGTASAFTTVENASRAAVAVPQTRSASDAKTQGAKRATDTSTSRRTTEPAKSDAPPKPSRTGQ